MSYLALQERGELEPSREKPLVKITKVHFLIHPGQKSDPNPEELLLEQGFKKKASESQKEEFARLSNLYLAQAEQVKKRPTELMVAFLHKTGKTFRKDFKQNDEEAFYAQIITKLKEILGNRLIVLSNDFDIVRNPQRDLDAMTLARKAYEALTKIAKAKGFEISKSVDTESYGEQILHCVKWGSFNLNYANNLKDKTLIRPKLTEAALDEGIMQEAAKKYRQMRADTDPDLKNIDYDFQ